MQKSTIRLLGDTISQHCQLGFCEKEIKKATEDLISCFQHDGKILVCGNGGSAADCEHIVGELMKGFLLERHLEPGMQEQIRQIYPGEAEEMIRNLQRAIPAISLVSQTALMTAFGNDVSSRMLFAQQVLGYGQTGDILFAISTSGNSPNVLYAAKIAKLQGLKVISLTGRSGGKLKEYSDIAICVPADLTYQIQELHLPVYHCLCACVENELFGSEE